MRQILVALAIMVPIASRAEEATLKNAATIAGKCRLEIEGMPTSCNSHVSWLQFKNGRMVLSFEKKGAIFELSGVKDEHSTPEDYYLLIDRFSAKYSGKDTLYYQHIQGNCLFRFGKAATDFQQMKCDILNLDNGLRYVFSLEDITSFTKD